MLDAVELKTVPSRPMTRDHLVQIASRFGRPLATVLALGATLLVVAGPGCADEGIGDPCTPEQEYNADFLGFDKKEVNVESKSFQCRTRLCLVNHFQGRVSCPYGQTSDAKPNAGSTSACTLPGSKDPILGDKQCYDASGKLTDTPCTDDSDCGAKPAKCDYVDTKKGSTVQPQCLDRSAANTVYCSCRCADINGQKPSDQTFCDCPDGFTCERLVTSIGAGTNEGLTGSYCIKTNTKYDPNTACSTGNCGDKPGNCGTQ